MIEGVNGARYRFGAEDFPATLPVRGQHVLFIADEDGRAGEIRIASSSAGAFDLGRVVQRTFRASGRHLLVRTCSAAVFVGCPSTIAAWSMPDMYGGLTNPVMWAFWLSTIANQVGFYLLMGIVVNAAISDFRGRTTTAREALENFAKLVLPLAGLGSLATLGIFAGTLFLLFPALILTVWWSVSGPVLAAERRPIAESMGRSIELTHGYRWRIFGLLIAYVFLSWIMSVALAGGLGAILGVLGLNNADAIAAVISEGFVGIITGVVGSTGAAALYYELRTIKEGDGSDELALIFD